MDDEIIRARRAILAVDVVESVRLIEADEAGAVAEWLNSIGRLEAMLPKYRGKLAKKLGDGLIIEFAEVREAVAAAFAIMELSEIANRPRPDHLKVLLRMAIHPATVLYAGNDLYGRGLNTAMRLLALAGPGEIVVSAQARDALTAAVDADVVDLGECYLKHVSEPVRAFRLGPPGLLPAMPPPIGFDDLAPVIAVMPFDGQPGDVVGEVIAEELIASLSRLPEFRLISRLSTSAVHARGLLAADIAARLGAHYVVSGTHRTVCGAIVIDAELAEGRNGTVVWSDRARASTLEILDVASDAMGRLVEDISGAILARELRRARSTSLATLDHYTLMISAVSLMYRLSRSDFEQSRRILDELIGRATRQALPRAWLANWHVLNVQQGWSASIDRDAQLARQSTRMALDADPECWLALAVDGFVHANLLKDLDSAEASYDLALQSNPSSGLARALRGILKAFKGDGSEAVANVEAGLRLSPFDPHRYFYDTLAAGAYYSDGQYEKAVEYATRSLRLNRRHTSALRTLAVCLHRLDRGDEARAAARQLMELEPLLTVSGWCRRSPAASFPNGQAFAQSLRSLGIPD